MKTEIYEAIKLLLQSDTTISAEHKAHILTACRTEQCGTKRRLVSVKAVAQFLAVHTKTVYRYVDRGLLGRCRFIIIRASWYVVSAILAIALLFERI